MPRYNITDTGCWEWTGFIGPNGYGQITVNRQSVLVHRFFYKNYKGPIAYGLTIDHLCKNKRCVNPDHLEAVTSRVNTFRSDKVPAAINRAKTHCIHGHELLGKNLYVTPYGRRQCRTCRSAATKRWRGEN